MTKPADLPTEVLVLQLRTGVSTVPAMSGDITVGAWMEAIDLSPGYSIGPPAVGLFWHYTSWCEHQGHAHTSLRRFATKLKNSGFLRGRLQTRGHDSRPYLVSGNSASMFADWLDLNPPPRSARVRVGNRKTKVEEALEELGMQDD